ncbi:MAG: hypothetical protein WA821_24190 [Anaerolineales bacterium]
MNTTKPATINPLAEGQIVIIVARFVLVLACLFLILMDAKSEKTVSFNVTRFEIMVVLLLAVSNFFLVAQVLTKRKTLDLILYGMSIADLAVITIVVIIQGGFRSEVYTFYFPAMLAFALAFPMLELYVFLGGTVFLYSFVSLFTLNSVDDIQTLLVRVLMLVAVAVCANHFAQIERNRRNTLLRNHFAAQQLAQGESQPASPSMSPAPAH